MDLEKMATYVGVCQQWYEQEVSKLDDATKFELRKGLKFTVATRYHYQTIQKKSEAMQQAFERSRLWTTVVLSTIGIGAITAELFLPTLLFFYAEEKVALQLFLVAMTLLWLFYGLKIDSVREHADEKFSEVRRDLYALGISISHVIDLNRKQLSINKLIDERSGEMTDELNRLQMEFVLIEHNIHDDLLKFLTNNRSKMMPISVPFVYSVYS